MRTVNNLAFVKTLKHFVGKLEELEYNARKINEDKAKLYDRARRVGIDVDALKRLVARRNKPQRKVDIEDSALMLYERALELAEKTNPLER